MKIESRLTYQRFLNCECGQRHTMPTFDAVLENDGIDTVLEYIDLHDISHPLVVADAVTWKVLGHRLADALDKANVSHGICQFAKEEPAADEYHLGHILQGAAQRPDCLISVGSGTVTDLTRYVAYLINAKHIALATAPSMDGYASSVAPLMRAGRKITFLAKQPDLIVALPSVLAQAPAKMLAAGFGDLMGKLTAKADWLLSHEINGEAYCSAIQGLVDDAVSQTMALLKANANGITEDYAAHILEGLIHSGAAITLVGFSRPASGAEHHLSHFWEMEALAGGHTPELHGLKVGYATWLILQVYEQVQDRAKKDSLSDSRGRALEAATKHLPTSDEYARMAAEAGVPLQPEHLRMDEGLVRLALREAMYVRDRYTILRFADEQGWLEEIAGSVTIKHV